MSILRTTLSVSAAVLAFGCSSSTGPKPADTFGGSATALSVDVAMPTNAYNPNHIDIAHGGVVNFIFGAEAHDVRFSGASPPADILASTNVTTSRTFPAAGTFTFLCTLHANMTGVVVVH